MKHYIIQEEIKVTQEFIDKLIEKYKNMPVTCGLGILSWSGNRDDIIREIKKMSEVGKNICRMQYTFQKEFPKWMDKFEKTKFGKAGKKLKEELEKACKDHN